MKALIGKKIGMTRILSEGVAIPITVIEAGPCTVTQIRTDETDGYKATQIGYGSSKLSKPQKGHFKASKAEPAMAVEIRGEQELKVGDSLKADVFSVGDKVKVTARTKGKGFAGTVKRHNFSIGPKSHGGRNKRKPGSIGSMYPQKIFKGKKMSGRMGGVMQTTKNLEIALVDAEKNIIGIKGAVPGPNKSYVVIRGVA